MRYIELDARAAIFSKESKKIWDDLLLACNNKTKKYFETIFRKYLVNEFPATKITESNPSYPVYINESVNSNEGAWLINITVIDEELFRNYIEYLNSRREDISGIDPRKLHRLYTDWNNAKRKRLKEKKKLKYNQIDLQNEIKSNRVKLLHSYDNDYAWVQILEKGLKREGSLMNHCVGNYKDKLKSVKILSLRNDKNHPLVTLDLTKVSLTKEEQREYGIEYLYQMTQLKANSNRDLDNKLLWYVKDLVQNQYASIQDIDPHITATYKLALKGNLLHPIYELKENDVVTDVTIDKNDIIILPNNLTVTRLLNISKSKIKSLPENLCVGMLSLGSFITEIPDSCVIKYSLVTGLCSLQKFPSLDVKDTVFILSTNSLYLPDSIKAKRIILSKNKIARLCKYMEADKIDLSDTNISNLPRIRCEHLNISDTKIKDISMLEPFCEIVVAFNCTLTKFPEYKITVYSNNKFPVPKNVKLLNARPKTAMISSFKDFGLKECLQEYYHELNIPLERDLYFREFCFL